MYVLGEIKLSMENFIKQEPSTVSESERNTCTYNNLLKVSVPLKGSFRARETTLQETVLICVMNVGVLSVQNKF